MIKLFQRISVLILAVLLVVGLTSQQVGATLTPAPSANFSPMFGNSSSTNFINVSFTLNANGHPGLVGKNLVVMPVVCNGISTGSWYDCEADPISATTVYLNDAYSSTSVTFSSLALYYLGNNYLTCYVYDPITQNGDLCGAEHYSSYSYFDYKQINYSGGLLPVYRFWSDTKKHHFFTINHDEKVNVQDNYSDNVWRYETPSFFASRSEVCEGSPVYRFWSDAKQGHFYTISEGERNSIIATYPSNIWRYEGIAYCAYPTASTSTPVYRFWSDTQQGHFYTADASERDNIINSYPSNVWRYEGIAFWAFS